MEYAGYKCHFTYIIARASIDLGLYKPIELKFRDKQLILTPQLLLDFNFLNQAVIIRDPDQTKKVSINHS